MVWLMRDDGSEVLGWRVYDSMIGKSSYWTHDESVRPTDGIKSRLQELGVFPVNPTSWRLPAVIDSSKDPISRNEAECLVLRAIRTDSALPGVRRGIKSILADMFGEQSQNAGDYVGHSFEANFRFVPSPRDHQNYLVAMAWFSKLGDGAKFATRKRSTGLAKHSIPQKVVAMRAAGLSFGSIQERMKFNSKKRSHDVYEKSIDRVWALAQEDQGSISRLPRAYYQEGPVLT
jgi:hypothetical protein